MRRRHYGIGAFASLVRTLHAERRVLAGPELELAAGIYPNAPKVGRKINSSGDPAAVKLVVWAHLIAALHASDLSHAAVDHEFDVACCRSLIASLL